MVGGFCRDYSLYFSTRLKINGPILVVFNLGYCFWGTISMAQKINFQYHYSLACHIVCNDCHFASNTIKASISLIEIYGRVTNKKPAPNKGFASVGVTPFRPSRGKLCKLGALFFYSSSVLVDLVFNNEVLRNPPEHKAQKRYSRFLKDEKQTKPYESNLILMSITK